MNTPNHKLLIIGIGNSGRRDDGLGWAFLNSVEKMNLPDLQLVYRYQLQIEDVALMLDYEQVLFVDAFRGILTDGFQISDVLPSRKFEFTTHSLSPEAILFLCEDLYGKQPNAQVLAIQGQEWGLQQGLSPTAQKNLAKAIDFFTKKWKAWVSRGASKTY